MKYDIRNEKESDFSKVEELTREAFWNLHSPGCDEHYLLHKMRSSSEFIPELDFVTLNLGEIIGNIVYCKAFVIDFSGVKHEVLTFGPLSVHPKFQKQGVGSLLINSSMKAARELGYKAVFIYGDPKYYRRFGFKCTRKFRIKTSDGYYAAALMALELQPGSLDGIEGKFEEGSVYNIDSSESEIFDAGFPAKEKCVTETQKRFEFLLGLRYK